MKVQLAFVDLESKKLVICTYTNCAEAIVKLHRVTSGDPADLIPVAVLVTGASEAERLALDYALERWCFD